MKVKIVRKDIDAGFPTPEGCIITELWKTEDDPGVSIARAKLLPGTSTALHCLSKIDERYVILEGRGRVKVGDLPETVVEPGHVIAIPSDVPQKIENIGDIDLIFLCICTPRFEYSSYIDLES